jgi:hypothetical protein
VSVSWLRVALHDRERQTRLGVIPFHGDLQATPGLSLSGSEWVSEAAGPSSESPFVRNCGRLSRAADVVTYISRAVRRRLTCVVEARLLRRARE